MPFKVVFLLCVALLVSGCLSTTTDVKNFDCQMTDRLLEDKTAKSEWVEKFLPSRFGLTVETSELTFQAPENNVKLKIHSKTLDNIVATGDIDLKNSNGDAFPMTYELSFDLVTKQYVLKARPYKLMAFGQQSGTCF